MASPAGGSSVNGLEGVDMAASDNVGVTNFELYAGGTLFGSDNSAPFGFSWDTTGLAEGSFVLEPLR
jgi:thermitase